MQVMTSDQVIIGLIKLKITMSVYVPALISMHNESSKHSINGVKTEISEINH